MTVFEIVVNAIVIISVAYVSFVLTLRDYLIALRKGEAVTLLPERGGRKYPLWVQTLIVFLGLGICALMFFYLWIPLVALPEETAHVLAVVGLILYLPGLALVLWARSKLGKMWGITTSQQAKLSDQHQLVQSGPYAFVRHPMYFGWWICMLGLTLLYPVWMVFLLFVFSIVAFVGRARLEESTLAERFGEAWTEYKRRTKFLIPFIL